MKKRHSMAFLYSLFLHGVIIVLVLVLLIDLKSEDKPQEKRCMVALSHYCEKVSEVPTKKPLVKPVEKKKKVIHKKPIVKKVIKPKKVVTKKVVEKKIVLPSEPKKVQELSTAPKEIVKEEVEPKEVVQEPAVVVTTDKPVVLNEQAKADVAKPVKPSSTPEQRYIKAHIETIMGLLRKNLYYPKMARRRHIEGKVMVRFTLKVDGSLSDIEILTADKRILADAAIETIERLRGKFPLPSEFLVLDVPIYYSLR